ncbi:hypothetical protein RD055328_05950 [Companilactobacillus sp. RD055328]|uniref:hypothetical protein n=1 Tax=Companilactobacillus sp. RD055328 TaxID=2916634 RepID=UPI001FC864A1|nr:hypothetical protein [Companilactobacillus sp. RD055328]GKQ42672.1 hypothetical protein RD055328_05950 [Companilactobacillus sp. RD055328]
MIDIDEYLNELTNLSSPFKNDKLIKKRINFIEETVHELINKRIPKQTFFDLIFDEDEIIQILKNTDPNDLNQNINKLEKLDSLLSYFRQFLQENFGYWATITRPFMDTFIQEFHCQKYLELMAGNGYISEYLREHDILSIATDSTQWAQNSKTGQDTITDIEELDALTAFKKYANEVDAIIIAWSPDYDEIDYQILQEYRKMKESKPYFFIIGEKNGATNSKKFWENVHIISDNRVTNINEKYPKYDIVNDKLYLIE